MSICCSDQPTLELWIATANAMYAEELYRAPDPSGLANWLDLASQGQDAEQIRAWMRTTPEWHALHDAPPVPTLEERAQIRGAMWTARLNLPWGPRPNQDDNCVCIDYFESFSGSDQDRILAAYGPASPRRYTSAPMGPIVDAGYHDQLPAVDWRNDITPYLDGAQKLEQAGVKVVHFLRPDRGCAGLEWTVADLDRELGPQFATRRAQAVMHTVCLGWEPGPKYYYNNDWWVEMCAWMARTFPNALRLIHMISDCDAPTGGDDDQRGFTNGQCWTNVAPYLHGFLAQYGGYVEMAERQIPHGSPAFDAGYAAFTVNMPAAVADMKDRFITGRGGWPTSSAWGPGQRLRVYYAEGAAYANYWNNWPEAESIELGRLAMAAGADGFLDGGQ